MFRDNVVAACWRLTDLGFGDIGTRKCVVDVQSFVLQNIAANIGNSYLGKFIHFYVGA
jgi:hypothetical protein